MCSFRSVLTRGGRYEPIEGRWVLEDGPKHSPAVPMSPTPSQTTVLTTNPSASAYQLSSMNETAAKKLVRKHGLKLCAFTKQHIVRVYPAGMRIDSSNYNPVQFWTCGVQMAALNFQTCGTVVGVCTLLTCSVTDVAMTLNGAMFEQNGNCGYVLKPSILWNPMHPMYMKFNPFAKDHANVCAVHFDLQVRDIVRVCARAHRAGHLWTTCDAYGQLHGEHICRSRCVRLRVGLFSKRTHTNRTSQWRQSNLRGQFSFSCGVSRVCVRTISDCRRRQKQACRSALYAVESLAIGLSARTSTHITQRTHGSVDTVCPCTH
jgi:hypothetical protein